MEGVVYGTKVIIDRMEQEQFTIDEIIACGGATQSDLWMQIHADVTGKPITITEEQQAVTLGSAIAAAVAGGLYKNLHEAAKAMVRTAKRVEPVAERTDAYREYVRQYSATYEALKEESSSLVDYADTIKP